MSHNRVPERRQRVGRRERGTPYADRALRTSSRQKNRRKCYEKRAAMDFRGKKNKIPHSFGGVESCLRSTEAGAGPTEAGKLSVREKKEQLAQTRWDLRKDKERKASKTKGNINQGFNGKKKAGSSGQTPEKGRGGRGPCAADEL